MNIIKNVLPISKITAYSEQYAEVQEPAKHLMLLWTTLGRVGVHQMERQTAAQLCCRPCSAMLLGTQAAARAGKMLCEACKLGWEGIVQLGWTKAGCAAQLPHMRCLLETAPAPQGHSQPSAMPLCGDWGGGTSCEGMERCRGEMSFLTK